MEQCMKRISKISSNIVGAASLLLYSLLLSSPASAQSLILNGSFEDGPCIFPLSTYGVGATAITDWQVVAKNVDLYCGYWTDNPTGPHAIDLNGDQGAGAIAQTFATIPGQKYQVRFAFAGNPDGLNAKIVRLRVSAASDSADFSFDTTGKSPANMGWVERYFPFTATSTTTTLQFESLSDEFCCTGPALDNVRVEVAPDLVFDNTTTASFSGTCSINGTPTLVTAQRVSLGRGIAPTQILSRDNNSFFATFSGDQYVQDTYTVTIDNHTGTATGVTSNTFSGSYDTATQAFPTVVSTASGPSLSTTVGGVTITSFTLGAVSQVIVNSIHYSSAPAFPENGSTIFFDITLVRPLILGGLNCSLNGQVESNVDQGMTLPIVIDIKPGSFPNSINVTKNGNTPVAILTTATFDASTVDPATVRFGQLGLEAAPVQSALADVDGDGDLDLILHFNTQQTRIACDDTAAFLTGTTRGGQMLEGDDSLKTTGCK